MNRILKRHDLTCPLRCWAFTFLMCFLAPQERSLSAAAGTAATRNLLVRMNSLATAELTLGRRSSCAQCATGVSCAATTWRNTPGATWPPRGSPAGRRRSAGWTEWPPQRTLGARRSVRRPPPERAAEGWVMDGNFPKPFFFFQESWKWWFSLQKQQQKVVLRARGAGSDERYVNLSFF